MATHSDAGGDELLRRYLDEVGNHPLLTAADEVALGQKILEGEQAAEELEAGRARGARKRQLEARVAAGAEAKQQFIVANLRLVVSIARRYQGARVPLIDLIQEGNLGLIRAVEKFDHRKGFKFSTYATWWIRQAITRALANKGRTIRVPVHVIEARTRVAAATAELRDALGRAPTPEEIAAACEMTAEQVANVQRAETETVSLSAPLGEFGDAELADLVRDENADDAFEAAAVALDREVVRRSLASLSERERRILEQRFGLDGEEPRTLDDIGREYRVTRERIRQIEAKALAKLRHPCTAPARGLVST